MADMISNKESQATAQIININVGNAQSSKNPEIILED
jgi:hypothetical protein